MLRRPTGPLRASSIPRNSIGVSHHGTVDAALKNLKTFSRRLNKALDAFGDEYRILERLYYKGNNQHRSALFWRRVSEFRRFCRRLNGIHIDQVALFLRSSFFDANANPKILRGSWTHLPETDALMQVLQRLSAYLTLVDKMQARLLEWYKSLNLAMQSGAFLQLILTLVAVSSRMSLVCEELQETVQAISGVVRQIIEFHTAAKSESSPHPVPHALVPDVNLAAGSHTMGKLDSHTTARVIMKRRIREPQLSVNVESAKTAAKSSSKKKTTKDEIDDIFDI